MRLTEGIPVTKIAEWIGAELHGESNILVTGINEIHKVEKGDITFVDIDKYYDKSIASEASVIIINKFVDEIPPGKAILLLDEPFEAFSFLAKKFRPPVPVFSSSIHESAVVHPSVQIGPNVIIANNVAIGADCKIFGNNYIGPYSKIGDRVVIQPGAIVGSEAYYFKKQKTGTLKKWHTVGRVVLEDDVEIGANCTVNSGVSGDTFIGSGTKLDSLIHVGHGAVLGKNCLVAAQVGIGGKTIIGNNVTLYGQVGVAHNLIIGDDSVILAKSGVGKNIEPGKRYFGIPAKEVSQIFKELAALSNLPGFFRNGSKEKEH
jgi:UDP-3-O-[3-hydroxymyristoyl] glucosamine N-acyltransferase